MSGEEEGKQYRLIRDTSTAAGSRLLRAGTIITGYDPPARPELVDFHEPNGHYWLSIQRDQLGLYVEEVR